MYPTLLFAFAAVVLVGLIYVFVVRTWFLRWGATNAEVHMHFPGDDLLVHPGATATRAITIQSSPDRVWPWLAQMGQGRGGLYSYAWLENLFGCQIINAGRIHPEWQQIQVGDSIRLHPSMIPIPIAILEPGHVMVLGSATPPDPRIPPVTWAFLVESAPNNATRLVIRWRSLPPPTFLGTLMNKYMLEPIHFLMERRMMLGIRDRAEAR
jgi:hypothetical protein